MRANRPLVLRDVPPDVALTESVVRGDGRRALKELMAPPTHESHVERLFAGARFVLESGGSLLVVTGPLAAGRDDSIALGGRWARPATDSRCRCTRGRAREHITEHRHFCSAARASPRDEEARCRTTS